MSTFNRQPDPDMHGHVCLGGLLVWWCIVGVLSMAGCQQQKIQHKLGNTVSEAVAREKAIGEIIACSQAEDPFLRANTIEAAQWLPDRALQLVQLGLQDENPVVRFTAIAMVGKLKLTTLVKSVIALRDDPSPSVQAATLYALVQCDQPVDITPLASKLIQPNVTLRGNVAMLLGRLGDASAIPMLKSLANAPSPRDFSLQQDAIVEVQVAEAMVALGYEPGLEVLRAKAYSPHDEVRITAVRALGFYNDRKFQPALVEMLGQDPIELRLAAAESLARMGTSQGLQAVLGGCQFDLPPVRAQAALALSLFTDRLAMQWRNALLTDPSQQVRLAAAAAILAATDMTGPSLGSDVD